MEKIKYILKQVRKYHYQPWDSDELEKCIDMMRDMPRHELLLLESNKWVSADSMLKTELLRILYPDQISESDESDVFIRNMEKVTGFPPKTITFFVKSLYNISDDSNNFS
jgi:hypothetical protein